MIDGYDIQPHDIPDGYQDVVDAIGMEAALKLVETMGGGPLYVPTKKDICRGARDRAIRAEFNGRNHRELATKHNLSLTWIRTIVGPSGRRRTGVDTIDRQLQLF